MPLNRESVLPLYHQIKEEIREQIARNEYKADERIPSENELAATYKVSRNTAKQAIAELVDEGILFREQGRGTFISAKKVLHGVSGHLSFSQEFGPNGGQLTSRVLSQEEMHASTDTAHSLGIPERAPILVIRRLRLLEGKPFSLQISFIPKELCPTLLMHDFNMESLFNVLSHDFNIVPHRTEEYLECKPASDYESEPMNVPLGTPLFLLNRTTYGIDGRIIESVRTYMPTDRVTFHFQRVNHVDVLVRNGESNS